MHVNVAKLKGIIAERGLSGAALSKQLGINPSTYYRKINSNQGQSLTLSQIFTIVSALSLSKQEAAEIFLADNSRLCESQPQCVKTEEVSEKT